MVQSTKEGLSLRQEIGLALKTTVRDVLSLVCQEKFNATNPGRTPYEVLRSNKKACNALKCTPFVFRAIKKRKIKELDVTVLVILLRWSCGLHSGKEVWKDLTRLEGNIDKLKQLRNEDAHWTQEGRPEEDLEDTWRQMVTALTNVLQMAGFQDHLDEVKNQLENIRKPRLEKITDWKAIRDSIHEELRELYGSGRKTTLMPIVWGGRNFSFNHRVEKMYTKTRLSTTHQGVLRELDEDSLLKEVESWQNIILEGESGTGKTSLLRHFAASWSAESPSTLQNLTKYDYLIFLDCTAVSTRTFTLSDIIQELLPNTYSTWKPGVILKELSKAEGTVMFLIDAFDERLAAFRDAFRSLQSRFSKASFVVTTRPHCTLAIAKLCESEPKVVTAHGFSRSSAFRYSQRLFDAHGKADDVEEFFGAISPHGELVSIPQLLCWSSWFWMEKGNEYFLTRGKVFAGITDFLLRKLCHISGKRILYGELPKEGRRWRSAVAHLSFKQAKHNSALLTESSTEVRTILKIAHKLKLPSFEALSSLLQCDSSMTGQGEHVVFQFVHESHANFLAALHVVENLQGKKNKNSTLTNLLKDLQTDRKKSVIYFIVSLMFEDGKSVDVQTVKDLANVCRPYIKFYDINFLLDIIEESGYSTKLAEELAKEVLELIHSPSVPLLSAATPKESFPQLLRGQLWLRPKELRRSRALSMLLTQVKPERLWLRLSEGPHADEKNSVRGHQVMEGNPVAAMRLVSQAYSHNALPELRLTDVTVSASLTWPISLWWLSLERCNIQCDLRLPSRLLKLAFIDCTGLTQVKFPSSLKSLKLENVGLDGTRLPASVETLVLSECTFTDLSFLPPSLKYLRVDRWPTDVEPIFPQSLEHLTVINNFSVEAVLSGQQGRFIEVGTKFVPIFRRFISPLKKLRRLSVIGIIITAEDFIQILHEFQREHPEGRLVVESPCKLMEDCTERESILASVRASRLREVTVSFGREKISHTGGVSASNAVDSRAIVAEGPLMTSGEALIPCRDSMLDSRVSTDAIGGVSNAPDSMAIAIPVRRQGQGTAGRVPCTSPMARVSGGKKFATWRTGNRVRKCSSGPTVTKKASVTRVTESAAGTGMLEEAFGTSVNQCASGTSVNTKASGTNKTKKAFGTRVNKNASGTIVHTKGSGANTTKKAFVTNVNENASGTSVHTKGSGTNKTKKAFGTRVNENASGTSVHTKGSGANKTKKTFETTVNKNASGTKTNRPVGKG